MCYLKYYFRCVKNGSKMIRIDISRIEELALAIQEEMAEDEGVDLIAFHCEFMRMERPRSPCEGRENPRQIGRAQGEVRKPT